MAQRGTMAQQAARAAPACTPGDVLALAAYYGVSLERKEFWLLDIARKSIAAPLLLPWREVQDATDGDVLYQNER